MQQQRAGERELALGGDRPVLAEIRAHGRGIEALLPERCLGAAAQEADARPARIVGDEGDIASEVDLVVVAAQDRPLDQLAGDRIADRLLDVARLRRLAFARQRDRFLDGGDIGRRGRRRRGDRRRCGGGRARLAVAVRLRRLAAAAGVLAFGRRRLVFGRGARGLLFLFRSAVRQVGLQRDAERAGDRKRSQKSGRGRNNQAVVLAADGSLSIFIRLIRLTKQLTGRRRDH